MNKLIFLALMSLGLSANAKVNDGVAWGCAIEDMELTMVKDHQLLPVFGLFYSSEYVGYGQVACHSVLKNEDYITNVKMTLKIKSAGLGTEKPTKLNIISLGTGIKVNSPDQLFAEHSVGAKVALTLFEGEAGLGLNIQNPKTGLVMDFGLFAEESKGLKLSLDTFSIHLEPVRN